MKTKSFLIRWALGSALAVSLEAGEMAATNVVVRPTGAILAPSARAVPVRLDFGDAPAPPYPTLIPHGARHRIIRGWHLGARVDGEPDGLPGGSALADDRTGGPDDEDGVTFVTPLIPGTNATVVLTASTNGVVDAWVDFNRSASWEPDEQILAGVPVGPGPSTLSFPVPPGLTGGDTFARFRFSRVGGLPPGGYCPIGEVEDYRVRIRGPRQPAQAPRLQIARDVAGWKLAWDSSEEVHAQLEEAPTLEGPWTAVPHPGDSYHPPLDHPHQFYRLKAELLPFQERYRVGFNMIRIPQYPAAYNTVTKALADLNGMGAQVLRQLTHHDVGWKTVYKPEAASGFDFSAADALFDAIETHGYTMRVIPTLFQVGGDAGWTNYPSTPDGVKVSDPSARAEVREYVRAVVSRYHDQTRYFEVCNELTQYGSRFSVSDYADLLILCRAACDAVDSDIRLVLGGLAGTQQEIITHQLDWLENLVQELEERGMDPSDYFDVVSLHYYDQWEDEKGFLNALQSRMNSLGLSQPVWLTEVGRSHVASTNWETDPHEADDSEEEQARDIFRKFSIAFGNGVELANWHTYFCRSEKPNTNWAGFGVRHTGGGTTLARYTYRLFANELGDFNACTALSEGDHVWAYRYQVPLFRGMRGGPYHYKWVLWSDQTSCSYTLTDTTATTVTATRTLPNLISLGNALPTMPVFLRLITSPDNLTLHPTPVLVEDGLLRWR